ncbi:Cu-binding protein [Rhizina undulata]
MPLKLSMKLNLGTVVGRSCSKPEHSSSYPQLASHSTSATKKAQMERKRVTEQTKGVGKLKVGGPLKLVDQNRNERSDKDF